jgi:hypothetical protein
MWSQCRPDDHADPLNSVSKQERCGRCRRDKHAAHRAVAMIAFFIA